MIASASIVARLLLALLACASCALANPPPVDRVAFAPSAGTSLPLDARFIDEHGRAMRLADYFGRHPAIVVLGYYACSNLCSVVLNGLAAGLSKTDLHAGRDFDVVVVSIDPRETPALAHAREREVLGDADWNGWHFLVGDERAIDAMTRALGYRYQFDDTQREFAHAAGVTIVRADGRVDRALYGVAFAPAELRDGLHDVADDGTIASAPRTWLLCFHYDPRTGRYTLQALAAVRVVALTALAALAIFAIRAWTRERREAASERGARP